MWRSRWRCVIKPAYSVSFLLSINMFVWQNVLYFLDVPRSLRYSWILVTSMVVRLRAWYKNWDCWTGERIKDDTVHNLAWCIPCLIKCINSAVTSIARLGKRQVDTCVTKHRAVPQLRWSGSTSPNILLSSADRGKLSATRTYRIIPGKWAPIPIKAKSFLELTWGI